MSDETPDEAPVDDVPQEEPPAEEPPVEEAAEEDRLGLSCAAGDGCGAGRFCEVKHFRAPPALPLLGVLLVLV